MSRILREDNKNEDVKFTQIYNNADIEKQNILKDNKGKAGIYIWTHIESGKRYVGSAVDLSKRFKTYFTENVLNQGRNLNSYINRALLQHGYSAFSLAIIEYIDTTDLDKKEARELILSREQFYIDSLSPEYNILLTAGSSLGYIHREESIALMSEIKKGEKNPMFGKTKEQNPAYGKTHSAESLALISEASKNRLHSIETKAAMSESRKGLVKSEEHRANLSIAKGTAIYQYSSDLSTLINKFPSANKAAEHFNTSRPTILKYAHSHKLFQDKWILSITIIDSSISS